MSNYNLKKVLCQLNQWCATNNISVQSVYDECHGMSLQDLVYYLFGVVKQACEEVVDYEEQFEGLYAYVNDYFNNLDVQQEINNKIDEMSQNGELVLILQPTIATIIDNWLSNHVTPTSPPLDNTFTLENAAAQSKATGSTFFRYRGTLSGDITTALIGLYDTNKETNTGLPNNLIYQYGYLICINTNTYIYISNNYLERYIMLNGEWINVSSNTYYQYSNQITGDILSITNIGSHTFAKNSVTNLPEDFKTNYGYAIVLTGYEDNLSTILLRDTSTPAKMWIYKNGWDRIYDSDKLYKYISEYNYSGNIFESGIGCYTFSAQQVSNIPPDFNANYGFLITLFHTSNTNISIVIEDNQSPSMWIYNTVKWVKIGNVEQVNNLNNKFISFIGDSITENNNTATNNYVNLLATNDSIIPQNLGISGTGFARGYQTSNNYINRINQITQNCELLCVSGSFNDLSSGLPIGSINDTGEASICGYINDFFTSLMSQKPTLKICCYTLNYWETYNGDVNEYIDALKKICNKLAIPFINVGEKCNIRPWISGNSNAYIYGNDGTHPNNVGHLLMYPIIKNFLESIC